MTNDALRLSRAALDDDSDGDLSPLCKAIIDGEHRDVWPRRDDRADEIAAQLRDLKSRIAKLETATKRTPRASRKINKADMELLADAIGKCLGQELKPLEQRLTKLEARSELKWAGVWHDGLRCTEGELVTNRGSLWLCTSLTHDRPGDNANAYRLIVKNGSHSANGVKRHATGIRE